MTGTHAGETVLVTGGTGYLAGWIMAGLLQRGYRVRTTVRSLGKAEQVRGAVSEQAGEEAARSIDFAAADLLADDGWDKAVHGCRLRAPYSVTPGLPPGRGPRPDRTRGRLSCTSAARPRRGEARRAHVFWRHGRARRSGHVRDRDGVGHSLGHPRFARVQRFQDPRRARRMGSRR